MSNLKSSQERVFFSWYIPVVGGGSVGLYNLFLFPLRRKKQTIRKISNVTYCPPHNAENIFLIKLLQLVSTAKDQAEDPRIKAITCSHRS